MKPTFRAIGAVAGVAILLTLAGCAGASTGLNAEAGEEMQSTVVIAADQAAAGDAVGALATLSTLESQLQDASETGDISPQRAAIVREAIDLVRTDLQSPAPGPTSEPVAPASEEPATTEPEAPATEPEDSPPGKDKDDKGNGKGNGKNK